MNIKKSLTRKIGPLPVWAWALFGFAGVWYYRNKLGGMYSGTGTGSVGPTPTTPQPQTTLQPGESVYDPNTGTLTTAPGSDSLTMGGGGSGSDYAQGIKDLADAIMAGQQGGGAATPQSVTYNITTSTPPQQKRQPKPKLTAKGAKYAPFGHTRPKARKGYTIKGLGRGYWEYVPKRKPKPKDQHGKPKATTKTAPKNAKTKPRSTASTKTTMRMAGRAAPTIQAKTAANGRSRNGAKPHATVARVQSGKRVTPVVQPMVVRQRPVAAATPRTAQRIVPPPPRPSAPPKPRTPARTVKPPPKPAPKKKR